MCDFIVASVDYYDAHAFRKGIEFSLSEVSSDWIKEFYDDEKSYLILEGQCSCSLTEYFDNKKENVDITMGFNKGLIRNLVDLMEYVERINICVFMTRGEVNIPHPNEYKKINTKELKRELEQIQYEILYSIEN